MNFADGDELDQFFDEQACDEFVKGINVEFGAADQQLLAKLEKVKDSKQEREVMAAIIVEDPEMLRSAVFGPKSDDFQISNDRDLK